MIINNERDKIICRCPYCEKAIGLELEFGLIKPTLTIKERKVNQKDYTFPEDKSGNF